MSKLSDRIRRSSKSEPAPFGFTAGARRAHTPSLLVVVRLPGGDSARAGDAAKAGADAVIVDGAAKAKDAGEATLGVAPEKTDRKSISALREAGADFVVLTPAGLAEAMLEEKIGFVLELRTEMEEVQLRLLSDLTLDAIIVAAPEPPITIERMLGLRRVAALARAALLAEVSTDADASTLQLLRDSGVAGVIVPASAIGKLGELRERIAGLPARGRRREEHAEALVPAQATSEHNHDDDFDDD